MSRNNLNQHATRKNKKHLSQISSQASLPLQLHSGNNLDDDINPLFKTPKKSKIKIPYKKSKKGQFVGKSIQYKCVCDYK